MKSQTQAREEEECGREEKLEPDDQSLSPFD
jgi:hypothetical protein